MASVLPLPKKIFGYISTGDVAALSVVSPSFVGTPLTLQERLMQMTLRFNAEQQTNAAWNRETTTLLVRFRSNIERNKQMSLVIEQQRAAMVENIQMRLVIQQQRSQLAALRAIAEDIVPFLRGRSDPESEPEESDDAGDGSASGSAAGGAEDYEVDTDAAETSIGDTEETNEGDDAEDPDESALF
jgi:hypothetical protein